MPSPQLRMRKRRKGGREGGRVGGKEGKMGVKEREEKLLRFGEHQSTQLFMSRCYEHSAYCTCGWLPENR